MADPIWVPYPSHNGPMKDAGGRYFGGCKTMGQLVRYFGVNYGREGGTTNSEIAQWLFHPIMVRHAHHIKTKFRSPRKVYWSAISRLVRIGRAMLAAEDDGASTNEELEDLVGTSSENAQDKFSAEKTQDTTHLFSALLFWWLRDLGSVTTFDHSEGLRIMATLKRALDVRDSATKAVVGLLTIDDVAWTELEDWPPGLRWSSLEEHHEKPIEYFNRLFEVLEIFSAYSTAAGMEEFLKGSSQIWQIWMDDPPWWWRVAPETGEEYMLSGPNAPTLDCPALTCRWKLGSIHEVDPTIREHLAMWAAKKKLDEFPAGGPIANPGVCIEFLDDVKRWRNKFRSDHRLQTYLLGIQKITLRVNDLEGRWVFDQPPEILTIYDREIGVDLSIQQITRRFHAQNAREAIFFFTFATGLEEPETAEFDDRFFQLNDDGAF